MATPLNQRKHQRQKWRLNSDGTVTRVEVLEMARKQRDLFRPTFLERLSNVAFVSAQRAEHNTEMMRWGGPSDDLRHHVRQDKEVIVLIAEVIEIILAAKANAIADARDKMFPPYSGW